MATHSLIRGSSLWRKDSPSENLSTITALSISCKGVFDLLLDPALEEHDESHEPQDVSDTGKHVMHGHSVVFL
jgi:hypothetical protein